MILIADDFWRKGQASDWEEMRPLQQVLCEDRWRAAQEGGHSGVGGVAGHFSKKREKWRTPRLFQAMLKDKPASYFVVKVAHPPDRN